MSSCWRVADPVEEGRVKAMQRSGAKRQYADYREMLAKERPELVGIGPRWTDQRKEMALAAIAAGAHVYSEKPFATDLAEADEILAAALTAGKRLRWRIRVQIAPPSILHLKKRIEEGLIGELLTIDAWGKQEIGGRGGRHVGAGDASV